MRCFKEIWTGGKTLHESEGKDKGISIPGCLRRLSNFERYLLWSAENNIAAVARILGDVQKDDLKRAIDSVGAVHPLMVARVVIDENHDVWFSTDHAQKRHCILFQGHLMSSGSRRLSRSTLCPLNLKRVR